MADSEESTERNYEETKKYMRMKMVIDTKTNQEYVRNLKKKSQFLKSKPQVQYPGHDRKSALLGWTTI